MFLKLGSSFYEVIEKEDMDVWGTADPQKGVIFIKKGIHPQDKYVTIFHEIVHLILQEAGIEGFIKKKHIEDFVEIFSTWLCFFLVDNEYYEILKNIGYTYKVLDNKEIKSVGSNNTERIL